MIPIIGNDIRTILGKLGAWPCDFGSETAVALYNVAMKNLPANGMAVDLTPSAGKSTVVLSSAAFRNGAKTYAVIDKASIHPVEEMWLNRAHRTFKMKDTCTLAEEITNMSADMIVIRGNPLVARQVFAEGLKPEGVLFGINLEKLEGLEPEQRGGQWAVWRKPKAVVLSVPDKPDVVSTSGPADTFRESVAKYSPSLSDVTEAIITEEEARALRSAK